jgi:hypothetical protein
MKLPKEERNYMSQYYEKLIKEYPKIYRRKSWKKETYYRFRLLEKKYLGVPKTVIDIREYIITEVDALWTSNGIFFTETELEFLIPFLTSIKKEMEELRSTKHGSQSGDRVKNTRRNSKEKKLS